ncbi:hypothetical protein PORCRE_1535 [Porphyromonas crevioricanis JCM 15906]|uniref:Uncharacterized protein n=1 Tax=Porphyromonas crevioricanis JCM 15906 TaxID=1305617 RepID=T1CIA6_9PORP|nr:hypothetical protein PORCRE_1535 [Porphyromonas crevioricanis JCM 15906]
MWTQQIYLIIRPQYAVSSHRKFVLSTPLKGTKEQRPPNFSIEAPNKIDQREIGKQVGDVLHRSHFVTLPAPCTM